MTPAARPSPVATLLVTLLLLGTANATPRNRDTLPPPTDRPVRPRHPPVASDWLFSDDTPLDLLVQTDMRRLLRSIPEPQLQPATVTLRTADSILFHDAIEIRVRGEFRKDNCSLPNILLDFGRHRSAAPRLHARIKAVVPCQPGVRYESLLHLEHLAYRMYALFTDLSFRVRPVTLRMTDDGDRRKPLTTTGFLIEDIDDMARRNGCHESDDKPRHPDQTDRQQMTLIALFQYMIGNPDWAVAQGHNIRLIRKDGDSLSRPIAVPYDFDYCGLVNAPYAIPDERLGIADVRTRIYMGPPRNLAEIRHIRGLFQERKEDVRRLVDTLPGMRHAERRDVWRYLEQFFAEIGEKDMDARLSPGGWGYSENNGPRPDGQGPDR